jgi:cytochrome P450
MALIDTSSDTLQWSMVLLANRPDVQRRVQAEIDSVIGRDRLPCYEDRTRLPFTEATMLEIMRYKPLLPHSIPHATQQDTSLLGFFIPAGTWILPSLHSVHMDPEEFDEPEQFRPERHLDVTGTTVVGRDKVIPFSIGKRSCLGEQLGRQQVFLFFVGLLQQFDISLPDGVDGNDETLGFGPVVAPKPFSVRFIARKKLV